MASDGDIHFPPGQRRGKPSFEPPPWEREQFEELARRKQAEATRTAGAEAPVQVEGGARQELRPEAAGLQQAPAAEAPQKDEPGGAPARVIGGGIDDKRVEALMMGLRAEEPRPEQTYWRVVAGSGAVSILVGLVITTWAVVVVLAPKRAGGGELLFEAMLLILGLSFVAGGLWVIFRSLRQQGVL